MSEPSTDDVLADVERGYRRHFSGEPERASVSFVGVDPIEILRFADRGGLAYLSLGMSRRPMTAADSTRLDEPGGPRAELMLSTVGPADDVWRRLAVLAAAPAVQSTVYRSGDRLHLDEPLLAGSRCFGGLLVDSDVSATRSAGHDPVQILRLLPATAAELAWSRVHGSDALVELWREQATPLEDLRRDSASLL